MSNILFLHMHFDSLYVYKVYVLCSCLCKCVHENHSEAGVCVTFLNKHVGDISG